jgi:hypothetical protein
VKVDIDRDMVKEKMVDKKEQNVAAANVSWRKGVAVAIPMAVDQ